VSHFNEENRALIGVRFFFSTKFEECKKKKKKNGENGYAYNWSPFLIICPAFVKVRIENKFIGGLHT
jgi:hypothetical protein